MAKSRRNIESPQTPLEISFERFETKVVRDAQFQPANDWSEVQKSEKAQAARIKRALSDFWFFDSTYFPPESHRQGYAKPGFLHKAILSKATEPGIHWFIAHRALAKTAYGMKILIWLNLRGDVLHSGIMTGDLNKSGLIMKAIERILINNARLKNDFCVEFHESNSNILGFTSRTNPKYCTLAPFSLNPTGRSVRGHVVSIDRIDFLFFDDLEVATSSFTKQSVENRLGMLVEAYKSLSEKGVALGFGNDLHPKCAAHRLILEKQEGIERKFINVYPFPDWSRSVLANGYEGSVWPAAFPAKSEPEMKKIRRITDETEWSQAQCNPTSPGGHIFPREFFQTYKANELPADAFGVAWCDQNLSLKGLGDTTALGALLYSKTTHNFYAYRLRCKSYSDPNLLLADYFGIRDDRINLFGMDGNVGQEAIWVNNVRNFCYRTNTFYPPLVFKNYHVDRLSSAAAVPYRGLKVLFPEEFIKSEEGQTFFEQFIAFDGKKAGNHDDAPDWFVCVYNFGFDLHHFEADHNAAQDYSVHSYSYNKYKF